MSALAWFPRDPEQWEQMTATLSFEQAGALDFVLGRAWRDKVAPCTLVDEPGAWQRLLGAKWKALLTIVREHFTPVDELPGRLRCGWLWALYQGQLSRYQTAAEKAQKSWQKPGAKRGPKPKAKSPAPTPADSSADSPANSSANIPAIADRRGVPPVSSRQGGDPPASDDAPLTPGGVASPSATVDDAPNGADRPDFLALVRDAMPDVPPPPRDAHGEPITDPPEITNPDKLAQRATAKRRWSGFGRASDVLARVGSEALGPAGLGAVAGVLLEHGEGEP